MPEPIVIRIQPITPLWTGDAEGKGSYVRETGILGSLRWWYEALVRGLGLYACDPSQGTCIFDKRLSSICLACQVLGCTGFSRRFRLAVEGGGDAGQPADQPREIRLKSPGTNNHRGWRIPSDLAAPFSLTFLPSAPGGFSHLERGALSSTLRLIERYGALGAKASQGQGVVRVTDWGAMSLVPPFEDWKAMLTQRGVKRVANPSPAPDLADFVGATITLDTGATAKTGWWSSLRLVARLYLKKRQTQDVPLDDSRAFGLNDNSLWIPSAPAVRARLRAWLRDQANFGSFTGDLRGERHRLMGVVQGQNTRGANIFVTHLYRPDAQSPWTMRIFGFVPKDGNEVDQAVRALLQDGERVAREVQAALGVSVTATPYPDQIAALLAPPREMRQ